MANGPYSTTRSAWPDLRSAQVERGGARRRLVTASLILLAVAAVVVGGHVLDCCARHGRHRRATGELPGRRRRAPRCWCGLTRETAVRPTGFRSASTTWASRSLWTSLPTTTRSRSSAPTSRKPAAADIPGPDGRRHPARQRLPVVRQAPRGATRLPRPDPQRRDRRQADRLRRHRVRPVRRDHQHGLHRPRLALRLLYRHTAEEPSIWARWVDGVEYWWRVTSG